MKTNLNSLANALLLICAVSLCACEDTIAELHPDNTNAPETVDPAPILEVANSSGNIASKSLLQGLKPFFYDIEKISCTYQGYTLQVKIYQPNNYKYSWIVDEQPAGTTNQLHCITGQKVYLTVTRYADNMTVSKYLELPPPSHESGIADDETTN